MHPKSFTAGETMLYREMIVDETKAYALVDLSRLGSGSNEVVRSDISGVEQRRSSHNNPPEKFQLVVT